METHEQLQFALGHQTRLGRPTNRRRSKSQIGDVRVFDFHGTPITTFEADGKRWVVMRTIFAALGLAQSTSNRKLNDSPLDFRSRIYGVPTVETPDHQGKICLTLSKYKVWVKSLRAHSSHGPLTRTKIDLFKRESANALFDFWRREDRLKDGVISGGVVRSGRKRQARMPSAAATIDKVIVDEAKAATEKVAAQPPQELAKAKGEIMGYIAKHICGPMNAMATTVDEKFTYIDERLKNSHARDAMILSELRAIRELLTRVLSGRPSEPSLPEEDPEAAAWCAGYRLVA